MNFEYAPVAIHGEFIVNAHEKNTRYNAVQRSFAYRHKINILGTDNNINGLFRAEPCIHAFVINSVNVHKVITPHGCFKNIAFTDEPCDKAVFGLVINICRAADLLNDAVIHNGNGVTHGEGFLLVVSNKDKRYAKLFLHTLKLYLHFLAEFEIECAEGLIQQKHLRFVHKRTRNGNALLLSAGKLVNITFFISRKVNKFKHFRDAAFDFILRQLAYFQAESNVFKYVKMRKQRIFLEYGVDSAFIRRNICQLLSVHHYFAR